jgi:hypothetical protein
MSRITLIKTFSFAVAFLSFTVSLNLSTHAQQSEPFSSGMGAIQLDQEVQGANWSASWKRRERSGVLLTKATLDRHHRCDLNINAANSGLFRRHVEPSPRADSYQTSLKSHKPSDHLHECWPPGREASTIPTSAKMCRSGCTQLGSTNAAGRLLLPFGQYRRAKSPLATLSRLVLRFSFQRRRGLS